MKLPETGFLRESQILPQREVTEEEAAHNRAAHNNRPRRARPGAPGLIPIGHATWWRGVKEGRFPKPVKLTGRVTAWRVEDIRDLITNGSK